MRLPDPQAGGVEDGLQGLTGARVGEGARPSRASLARLSPAPQTTHCPGPRLLAHRDDDGIAPEAEHQPRPLRLQVHDHTRLVLQPEIARTRRAAGLTRLGPWYQTRSWHLRLGG